MAIPNNVRCGTEGHILSHVYHLETHTTQAPEDLPEYSFNKTSRADDVTSFDVVETWGLRLGSLCRPLDEPLESVEGRSFYYNWYVLL